MPINATIKELVENTMFVDTHEHIIEESIRLQEPNSYLYSCNDFAYVFWGYTCDDLVACGMPLEDRVRFLGPEADIDEKWRLLEPWWPRVKHAGYGLATRLTLKTLYGEDDITADNYQRINATYHSLIKPGYYYDILRSKAKIASCQVNSLMHPFCETEYPDLLMQDISLMHLSTMPDIKGICQMANMEALTLQDWLKVIDWMFATYGPRAVAVKSQVAYLRRLDFEDVPYEDAAPAYEKHLKEEELSAKEKKALEDFCFRYCVVKATEYSLPIKLHTGFYAGVGHMPLDRVGMNPADICRLAMDFPTSEFVVMHIGYPYQDEMVAAAKHHTNIKIDMCWAWIINPHAAVRMVKDFIMAAPANKLFTFGGDYLAVEAVVGHAIVARQGLTQALSELVDEKWITEKQALELVPVLMHGNAEALFPHTAGVGLETT